MVDFFTCVSALQTCVNSLASQYFTTASNLLNFSWLLSPLGLIAIGLTLLLVSKGTRLAGIIVFVVGLLGYLPTVMGH